MRMLCHRGWWINDGEKNSVEALGRAFDKLHGVETDIRDLDGTLVISHDPPRKSGAVVTFESMLALYLAAARRPLLALNIKSDGLQDAVKAMLARFDIDNYFVFDMSVPDTIGYLRRNMHVAVRMSEFEQSDWFLQDTNFIWLDAFESEWYTADDLETWLSAGKRVCVVSSELHRRPHANQWNLLAKIPRNLTQNLYLCTDLFDEASEVFELEKD